MKFPLLVIIKQVSSCQNLLTSSSLVLKEHSGDIRAEVESDKHIDGVERVLHVMINGTKLWSMNKGDKPCSEIGTPC